MYHRFIVNMQFSAGGILQSLILFRTLSLDSGAKLCACHVGFWAVSDKLLRSGSDDFVWPLDYSVAYGKFLVEVEFHDLKIASSQVSPPYSTIL